MKNIRWLAFAALASIANLAFATTYSFTGPLYSSATGLYTTSMRITGSFTTSAALPANMPLTNIGPGGSNLATSWSFSDGVSTYTNINSVPLYGSAANFAVATDASGNISSYNLGFMSPLPPNIVGQLMNAVFFATGAVQATTLQACNAVAGTTCSGISAGGTNFASAGASGVWTAAATAVVQVPTLSDAALVLLGLSIVMLAYMRRRRAS